MGLKIMDMLTGEKIADAKLVDWRKLAQGIHALYLAKDFGAGARFVAAVGDTPLTDGKNSGVAFSVAGGVSVATIAAVRESGAEVAVAGGAIYGATDVGAAAAELRAAIV